MYTFKGTVIGGDWYRLEKKFENLYVYLAFKQVLIEGKRNTVFYQRILDQLNRGQSAWGCAEKSTECLE
jgi:hypothetical protein